MRRWKISKIMYMSFFSMITIPIVLVTLYAVETFKSILLSNTTSQALQTLEQISYTFDSEARMLINTVSTIANDDQIIVTASAVNRADGAQELLERSKQLDKLLNSYFHYTADLVGVVFFYTNGGAYEYKRTLNAEKSGLRALPWYREVLSAKNRVRLIGIQDSAAMAPDDGHYFSAAVSPKYSSLLYDVEMIYFMFNARKFLSLLDTNVHNAGAVYVVDGGGAVMASTEAGALRQGIGAGHHYLEPALAGGHGGYIDHIDMLRSYIVYTTSGLDWKYIKAMPYEEIVGEMNRVLRNILLVAAVGAAVFILVSYLLVRGMVNPVVALVRRMRSDNLKLKVKAAGPLEIYILGNAFNQMVENIDRLLHEVSEKEKQKRRAEMDALQSQINPHFLINTLNVIKLMATISKASNIQKMTEALMKLLSSSFNKGGMFTTVGEEVALLHYYIHIMKIRYGDLFDIEFTMDKRLEEAVILKLLLQPIIENAIIHGMHERETRGMIKVTGRIVGGMDCQFTVSDNGVGMDEETLRQTAETITTRKERFSGIGLKNVHDRIQLHYGERYGIDIASAAGGGTTVTMLVPLIIGLQSETG